MISAFGTETGHTGTQQGAKMLLGGLLKGKKILRKRGGQQGCGDQDRREDGGTLHSSGSLLFPHPSLVCGFAFAACKAAWKECAAGGFRQVGVNLG